MVHSTRSGVVPALTVALWLSMTLWSPVTTAAEGMASYYGKGFHGRRTASGQRFNQHALTAAHRSLRFGTRVRVTNLRNRKSVVVTINDRGPYAKGRIVDLSRAAAQHLGMIKSGVARVRLKVVGHSGGESVTRKPSKKEAQASLLQQLF
jgi:rare lipoprotein A